MKQAYFFDLDSTIIVTESGQDFPRDSEDWKFKPKMLEKICQLYKKGIMIFVVTNQAGMDEGYVKPNSFELKRYQINKNINNYVSLRLDKDLRKDLIDVISWWFVAVSNEDPRKKPSPDFAKQAKEKFKLNLKDCVMIGDASGLTREIVIFDKKDHDEKSEEFMTARDLLWQNKKELPQKIIGILDHRVGEYVFRISNKVSDKLPFEKDDFDMDLVDIHKVTRFKKDFSDSDKMFAKNAGMKYMDIDEFLE